MALPGENEKDPREIPYSVVVKWKEFHDKGIALPFETPRDEFIQAPNCPTQYQLMQRWEGLPGYWDIPALYADPFLSLERSGWQVENLAKKNIGVILSEKAREVRHAQNILTVQKGIQEIEELLQTGVHSVWVTTGNQRDGFDKVEQKHRLTPQQIARLRVTQGALIKLLSTLDGNASEIIVHQHSAVGVLEQAMRAALAGRTDKDGLSIEELEAIASGELSPTAMLPAPSDAHTLPAGFVPTNVIDAEVVPVS